MDFFEWFFGLLRSLISKSRSRFNLIILILLLGVFSVYKFVFLSRKFSTIKTPFEVSAYFYPSGWMGDAEEGTDVVQFDDQWKDNCKTPPCIRISYHPSGKGWAGMYWQYPDSNWGDKPGRKIVGATKIVFWARGENGGEIVKFKAGGISAPNKRYQDSFEVSTGFISLSKKWKKYEIDLTGADLSSVIGAFAWIAKKNGNLNTTFYLDDICYQ